MALVVLIGGKPEARRSLEEGNLGIDRRIILRRMSNLVVTSELTQLPQEMDGWGVGGC